MQPSIQFYILRCIETIEVRRHLSDCITLPECSSLEIAPLPYAAYPSAAEESLAS